MIELFRADIEKCPQNKTNFGKKRGKKLPLYTTAIFWTQDCYSGNVLAYMYLQREDRYIKDNSTHMLSGKLSTRPVASLPKKSYERLFP